MRNVREAIRFNIFFLRIELFYNLTKNVGFVSNSKMKMYNNSSKYLNKVNKYLIEIFLMPHIFVTFFYKIDQFLDRKIPIRQKDL